MEYSAEKRIKNTYSIRIAHKTTLSVYNQGSTTNLMGLTT